MVKRVVRSYAEVKNPKLSAIAVRSSAEGKTIFFFLLRNLQKTEGLLCLFPCRKRQKCFNFVSCRSFFLVSCLLGGFCVRRKCMNVIYT